MKLKNKKTGKMCELKVTVNGDLTITKDDEIIGIYSSLAELNKEWEDVPEEPKEYWFINASGETNSIYEEDEEEEDTNLCKEIGNYFNTREEAEKAVEKLKTWKRLKDKGVKIIGYYCDGGTNTKGEFSGEVNVTIDVPQEVDINLFYLLFGGEE